MVKKYVFLILFCITQIRAYESQPITKPTPFALFTIPKSGSHLVIKSLYFMTGFTPLWHVEPFSIDQVLHQNHFPYTHCCLSSPLLEFYSRARIKQILGVRDLRDVCVSTIVQILKGTWPQFTGNQGKINAFKNLSFDEQLLFVINQEYELAPGVNLQLGMRKVADQVVNFLSDPNILVCRYEDIIGPQGGGSSAAQKQILEKMASHIGVHLSPEKIEEIAAHLYGNEDNPFGQGDFKNYQSTFHKGQIGSWKKAFKPIHKEAFKKRLGDSLIALGYEQDHNW